MPLLVIKDLDLYYGDFQAVQAVSLAVEPGTVCAVVGANGAGKSTLLRALAGVVSPRGGRITFRNQDITDVPAHKRVTMGIALVPEGRRLFASMTLEENLLIGSHVRRPGPWSLESVYEVFPFLADRRRRIAGSASGGEQQATSLGRALLTNPELLLIDEASLGLAPVVVESIYACLPQITAGGTAVLLVEQDVALSLNHARDVYCLLEGRVALSGPSDRLSRQAIANAYFGIESS